MARSMPHPPFSLLSSLLPPSPSATSDQTPETTMVNHEPPLLTCLNPSLFPIQSLSLSLSTTPSLSRSLPISHPRPSHGFSRSMFSSDKTTVCAVQRMLEDTEMVGHGFPTAQLLPLADVCCTWGGCGSPASSVVIRPVLAANLGANQFLLASSSQWYTPFVKKVLGSLTRFSMQNDKALLVDPAKRGLILR